MIRTAEVLFTVAGWMMITAEGLSYSLVQGLQAYMLCTTWMVNRLYMVMTRFLVAQLRNIIGIDNRRRENGLSVFEYHSSLSMDHKQRVMR